jgi:hypothetical protein
MFYEATVLQLPENVRSWVSCFHLFFFPVPVTYFYPFFVHSPSQNMQWRFPPWSQDITGQIMKNRLVHFQSAPLLSRSNCLVGQHPRNNFANDHVYIGTRFLLRLVREQGLVPSHLLKIVHTHTGTTHIIALFPDGRYLCDCTMGPNLGVVCRHYFLAWVRVPGLPFHISLIRARQATSLFYRCSHSTVGSDGIKIPVWTFAKLVP